ncbi:MAG: metal ABC transporter permease [Bauldia sp.]
MSMFDYDFMRTAFAASGVVALVAGIVGVFLVGRGQTFAGHALSPCRLRRGKPPRDSSASRRCGE